MKPQGMNVLDLATLHWQAILERSMRPPLLELDTMDASTLTNGVAYCRRLHPPATFVSSQILGLKRGDGMTAIKNSQGFGSFHKKPLVSQSLPDRASNRDSKKGGGDLLFSR